jgi:hypothetical protein
MDDKVNEHEKDRVYCPFGVFFNQILEHFIRDVRGNDLRIYRGCLLIKAFKLVEDTLLEGSDELLLFSLPIFDVVISYITDL